MAEEISNYLSTPDGYATPDQLAAVRSYAKALLQGEGQQNVHHWTQGVSNMVNALMGGLLVNKAASRELGSRGYDADMLKDNIPKQNYRQDATSLPSAKVSEAPGGASPASSTGEQPKAMPASMVASATGTDPLARQKAGIHAVESVKNGYDELGPVIKNPKSSYYGDRAYGKYQVMGKNIPEWTKEALGVSMTPDQFIRDRAAQEKVFEHKFGQLRKKYGNDQDAASAWFTGRPLSKGGAGASDGYINGAEYVRRFNKGMGGSTAPVPQTTAFTQEASLAQAPAVQATVAALRGDAAPESVQPTPVSDVQTAAAAKGAAGPGAGIPGGVVTPVAPQGGPPPVLNPALIKPPPEYNERALRGVLASPWLPQEVKDRTYGMALQQGQAIRVPVTGGTMLIDPRNPQNQQFIPDIHWSTKEIGGIKKQVPQVVSPYGGGGVITLQPPGTGPRSDAAPAPTQAPAGGPQGMPAATPASVVAGAETPPAAPAGPANGVQVASLDPAAGAAAAQAAIDGGDGGGDGAPVIKTAGAAPVVGTNQPSQRDNRLNALKTAPPGVDQEDWDALTAQKDLEANTEIMKEQRKKAGDLAAARYNDAVKNSEVVPEQLNNIALAKEMMNDPNFNSGMLSNIKDTWNRFREAVLGEKNANMSNESFDKIMASQVLQSMKSTLQGLGQVRWAEIELLRNANANRHNTLASNKAVLEITERNLMKHQQLMSMANDYVAGNEVTDPVTGKVLLKADPNRDGVGLDAGWNKLAKSWSEANPAFKPEEIKTYQKVFATGKNPDGTDSIANPKPGEKGAAAGGSIPPGAIDDLKKNPASRDQFDAAFGAGASDKILGPRAAKPPEPPISR